MGTYTMKAVVFFALALAVTGIWAVTEVQELGNDDSSTGSSSSVSLDADDSAEFDHDDHEMGETVSSGAGVGRRGAFLQTTGSFTLSAGMVTRPISVVRRTSSARGWK